MREIIEYVNRVDSIQEIDFESRRHATYPIPSHFTPSPCARYSNYLAKETM